MYAKLWKVFNQFFEALAPWGDLFIRFWIAKTFFLSGLLKLQSWDSTLFLFSDEYQVPLLPPTVAAYLGTAAETILPIFVLLGLFGRVPTLLLFVFNIVAACSYPFLWTPPGAVGLMNHFYWGLLIMVILLHGTGKISVDRLICSRRK